MHQTLFRGRLLPPGSRVNLTVLPAPQNRKASFPASGSSLLALVPNSLMVRVMAPAVHQHPVVQRVLSSCVSWNNMVFVHIFY